MKYGWTVVSVSCPNLELIEPLKVSRRPIKAPHCHNALTMVCFNGIVECLLCCVRKLYKEDCLYMDPYHGFALPLLKKAQELQFS